MSKRITYLLVFLLVSAIGFGKNPVVTSNTYIQGQGANILDFVDQTFIDQISTDLKNVEDTTGYQYAVVVSQQPIEVKDLSEVDEDKISDNAIDAAKDAYKALKLGKGSKNQGVLVHLSIITIQEEKDPAKVGVRFYLNTAFGKGVPGARKLKIQQDLNGIVIPDLLDKTQAQAYIQEVVSKIAVGSGGALGELTFGPITFVFDPADLKPDGGGFEITSCSFDLGFNAGDLYQDTLTITGAKLTFDDAGTKPGQSADNIKFAFENYATNLSRDILFFNAKISGYELEITSEGQLKGTVDFSGSIPKKTKVVSFLSVQQLGSADFKFSFSGDTEGFVGDIDLTSINDLKFDLGPYKEPWATIESDVSGDGTISGAYKSTEDSKGLTVFDQGGVKSKIENLDISFQYSPTEGFVADKLKVNHFAVKVYSGDDEIAVSTFGVNGDGLITGDISVSKDVETFKNGEVTVVLKKDATIKFETDLDSTFNLLDGSSATITVNNKKGVILTAVCSADQNKFSGDLKLGKDPVELMSSGKMIINLEKFEFGFNYHFVEGFQFKEGSGKITVKEGRTTRGFVELSVNGGKAVGNLSISDPLTLFRTGDVKTSLDKLQGKVSYTPSDGFKFLSGSMTVSVKEGNTSLATSTATLDGATGRFKGKLHMANEAKLFGSGDLETKFQIKNLQYEFILGDTFALRSGDVTIRMLNQETEIATASLVVDKATSTVKGQLKTSAPVKLYGMSDMQIKLNSMDLAAEYSFTSGFTFNSGSAQIALYKAEVSKASVDVTVNQQKLHGNLNVAEKITMYERGDFQVDLKDIKFEFEYDFNNGFELVGESGAGVQVRDKSKSGEDGEIVKGLCTYDPETKLLGGEIKASGIKVDFPMSEFKAELKRVEASFVIDFAQEDFVFTKGLMETRFKDIKGIDGELFANFTFKETEGTVVAVGINGEATAFGLKITDPSLEVTMDRDFDITKIQGSIGIYSEGEDNFVNIENFVIENGTLTEFKGSGQLQVTGFRFKVENCEYTTSGDNWMIDITAEMEVGMEKSSNSVYVKVTNFTIDQNGVVAIGELKGDIEMPMFEVHFTCSYQEERFKGSFDGEVAKFTVSGQVDIGKASETSSDEKYMFAYVVIDIGDLDILIPPTPVTLNSIGLMGGYNYWVEDERPKAIFDWSGDPQYGSYAFGAKLGLACCGPTSMFGITGTAFGQVDTKNGNFAFGLGLGLDIPANDPYLNLTGTLYYKYEDSKNYFTASLSGTLEKENSRRERLFYAQMSATLGLYPDYWFIENTADLEIYKGILKFHGMSFFQKYYDSDDIKLKVYGDMTVDADIDESIEVGSVASARIKLDVSGRIHTPDTIVYEHEELSGSIHGNLDLKGRIEASAVGCSIDPIIIDAHAEGRVIFLPGKKMFIGGKVHATIDVPLWGDENVDFDGGETIDYS